MSARKFEVGDAVRLRFSAATRKSDMYDAHHGHVAVVVRVIDEAIEVLDPYKVRCADGWTCAVYGYEVEPLDIMEDAP